jgi:hypothetical protein
MTSISALSKAHLPTLEQITHRDPFELVDSPWGKIEAWRASTMATGTMGALAQVAAIVRNDAAELEQKSIALDAKRHQVLRTVNRLLSFMSRVDALSARVEELEAKRRADEAAEREFEEEPITLPPDIAEQQMLAPPEKIGDETSALSGELHAVAPNEEAPPSDFPEPPHEIEDAEGDLPNELVEAPEPVPEPKGRVYPQPTAISLNTE